MDAVELMFRAFPAPEHDDKLHRRRDLDDKIYKEIDSRQYDGLFDTIELVSLTNPVYSDHAFIAQAIQDVFGGGLVFNILHFRQKILQLSLSKQEIPNDGTAKSNQMRYSKWIGQGRKDSDRSIPPTATADQECSSLAFPPHPTGKPSSVCHMRYRQRTCLHWLPGDAGLGALYLQDCLLQQEVPDCPLAPAQGIMHIAQGYRTRRHLAPPSLPHVQGFAL